MDFVKRFDKSHCDGAIGNEECVRVGVGIQDFQTDLVPSIE